ncbi:MAG: hypothetical protein HRT66_05665, partial [Flavobacteriaceae bacterium]|nr:hypothetical protein [Flavobacteriaceae bacterium]
MKKIIFLLVVLAFNIIHSQIGIGTKNPDENSILEISSSDKGVILPRLYLKSISESHPLKKHISGMIVYNISNSDELSVGYYYNDGSKWIRFLSDNDNIENSESFILHGTYSDLNRNVGKEGDYFLDLDNYRLYGPKGVGNNNDSWGTTYTSLKGAPGNEGTDGKGISSGEYEATTGIVKLTYTDNSSTETGDLRGADGKGISS